MDEIVFINIVKNVSLFAGIVGIVAGLDLLSGAKIISALKKVLDKVFNIDQSIIRISSALRKKLDSAVYIDDVIIKTKSRVVLGGTLLFFSALILLLVTAR